MSRFLTLYIQNKRIKGEFSRYASMGLIQSWTSRPELFNIDIRKDDSIYWVTVQKGVLYIIMAMVVRERLTYEAFAQQYGKDLADLDQHRGLFFIASKATEIKIDRPVSGDDVKKIRWASGEQPAFDPSDSPFLDKQAFRGHRWLSEESAEILNKYLHFIDVTPDHIAAWRNTMPNHIAAQRHTIPTENNYIPTQRDCENIYRKITKIGSDIPIEELLNQVEKELRAQGKTLDREWRSTTEKNLKKWYPEE